MNLLSVNQLTTNGNQNMIESNKNEVLPLLRGYIAQQFKTNKAAAPVLGVSQVHLSRILNQEHVEIPDNILELIGYKKITSTQYSKI